MPDQWQAPLRMTVPEQPAQWKIVHKLTPNEYNLYPILDMEFARTGHSTKKLEHVVEQDRKGRSNFRHSRAVLDDTRLNIRSNLKSCTACPT